MATNVDGDDDGSSRVVPFARCRVLYIGRAAPSKNPDGLTAVQKPLHELYTKDIADHRHVDLESTLTAFNSGVLMTPTNYPAKRVWLPMQNLETAVAVRPADVDAGAPLAYVPVDSTDAALSEHPAIFAAIFRRTDGLPVTDCYAFICKSNAAAMALVDACVRAHSNPDGWSPDGAPPPVIPHDPNIVGCIGRWWKSAAPAGNKAPVLVSSHSPLTMPPTTMPTMPPTVPVTVTPMVTPTVPAGGFWTNGGGGDDGSCPAEYFEKPPLHGYFYTPRADLIHKFSIATAPDIVTPAPAPLPLPVVVQPPAPAAPAPAPANPAPTPCPQPQIVYVNPAAYDDYNQMQMMYQPEMMGYPPEMMAYPTEMMGYDVGDPPSQNVEGDENAQVIPVPVPYYYANFPWSKKKSIAPALAQATSSTAPAAAATAKRASAPVNPAPADLAFDPPAAPTATPAAAPTATPAAVPVALGPQPPMGYYYDPRDYDAPGGGHYYGDPGAADPYSRSLPIGGGPGAGAAGPRQAPYYDDPRWAARGDGGGPGDYRMYDSYIPRYGGGDGGGGRPRYYDQSDDDEIFARRLPPSDQSVRYRRPPPDDDLPPGARQFDGNFILKRPTQQPS